MKRLRPAASVALAATLLFSGCASGIATVTGTLEVGNGHCIWVRVPGASGDLYSLRHLPSGYEMDEQGLMAPDGSRIRIGDPLTVSGDLSWEPLEQRDCETVHVIDATAIE